MDLDSEGRAIQRPALTGVILLDTNALIWWEQGHRRVQALGRRPGRLYISPASLLEVQFLLEAGRIRLRDTTVAEIAEDERWILDDPPAASWFIEALGVSWTRDPFDRLLVAHARLRGWRLATGDRTLLARVGASEGVEI